MSILVPVLGVGGAVVAYQAVATPAKPPGPTQYTTPSPGSSPPAPPRYTPPGGPAHTNKFLLGSVSTAPAIKTTTWNYGAPGSSNNIDPSLRAKLDAAMAYAKKQFENANEVAKAKAADALNKEFKLDPKLTGHEDWDTISAVVGGATGAALGAAIGGPFGAKVGALLGAYASKTLTDWIDSTNWASAYPAPPGGQWFKSYLDDLDKLAKLSGGHNSDGHVFVYNEDGGATITKEQSDAAKAQLLANLNRAGYHGETSTDRENLNEIVGSTAF